MPTLDPDPRPQPNPRMSRLLRAAIDRTDTAPRRRHFGESLHVDSYGVDPALCDDLNFNYQLLLDLASELGMSTQAPPYLFRTPPQWAEKAGLSGFLPLIESGISVHTLNYRGFISHDIYTCSDVDVETMLSFLADRLKSSHSEHHFLVRGLEYHQEG